jgi:hypothetical protein
MNHHDDERHGASVKAHDILILPARHQVIAVYVYAEAACEKTVILDQEGWLQHYGDGVEGR